MRTARVVLVTVLAGVASTLLISCASGDGAATSPDEPSIAQPEAGREVIELAVLEALGGDGLTKEAAYFPGEDRVVVTIYTEGHALSDEELEEYQQKAEDVTSGISVDIMLSDVDPPTLD